MEKFVIHGGKPLHGTVQISGAKNAAVALVAATILCDEPCVLENVPEISDITKYMKILREMGAEVRLLDKNTIYFDTKGIEKPEVPYESVMLFSWHAAWKISRGFCSDAGRL